MLVNKFSNSPFFVCHGEVPFGKCVDQVNQFCYCFENFVNHLFAVHASHLLLAEELKSFFPQLDILVALLFTRLVIFRSVLFRSWSVGAAGSLWTMTLPLRFFGVIVEGASDSVSFHLASVIL